MVKNYNMFNDRICSNGPVEALVNMDKEDIINILKRCL